jgi:signal transduction histidine kinase
VTLAQTPHPLARRIHDGVMQLLGTALLKTEMCEQLLKLGREDEIPANLVELRSSVEATIVEVRSIMADLYVPADKAESQEQRAA